MPTYRVLSSPITLLDFINESTDSQFLCYARKANKLTGPVILLDGVEEITQVLKERFGLKTNQTAFARKLLYASTRHHYLDGKSIMEDILSGQYNRHPKSYV